MDEKAAFSEIQTLMIRHNEYWSSECKDMTEDIITNLDKHLKLTRLTADAETTVTEENPLFDNYFVQLHNRE
jgi:hypothetical protein